MNLISQLHYNLVSQILVRDDFFERQSLMEPAHYIFFKILQVGIKNDVGRH